jgi:hypothetical protein
MIFSLFIFIASVKLFLILGKYCFPAHSSRTLFKQCNNKSIISFRVEGYIFFDIFATNQQQSTVRMLSPVIDGMGSDDLCFTFWYFAFGAADSTQLHVLKTDPGTSTGHMVSISLLCQD